MCGANKLTGSQSYYRMSEFHFLVMVLFSTIISCFVLDLLEPQEMVCLTEHVSTFSSLNISRRAYCSGYDEHACDKTFFPKAGN